MTRIALIIADSRGGGLQPLIRDMDIGFEVHVLVHPGAGLELAVLRSISAIHNLHPDIVLMLAGICDLTWKHRLTKMIALRYMQPSDNITQVMNAIKASYDLLRANGDFIISYATLTGVDLSDCNHRPRANMSDTDYLAYCATKTPHPSQWVLDETILAVNKQIVKFNKNNGTKTAWIAGLVHTYSNKTYHHHYRRLRDGCHPNHKTTHAWVAQIVKSLARISPKPKIQIE